MMVMKSLDAAFSTIDWKNLNMIFKNENLRQMVLHASSLLLSALLFVKDAYLYRNDGSNFMDRMKDNIFN